MRHWFVKALAAPVAVLAVLVTAGAAAADEPAPKKLQVELSVDIDYVDPALAYYIPTWTIEYATCAKLVNYPDRPAPQGGLLKPEVARAMPTVSADGRTYTFELRDDFVFSPPSNERVTADHFKWAIDRALNRQMSSPAQPFLQDIVGAREVIDGTATSVSGVVADGNTLRITLLRPAGNFLARLAMPFACPLPRSVPVDLDGVDAPVPSAGPYYIASWTRNREVLIKENPNYTGSRPHHFDEIHYGIGLPLETIKLQIDQGSTDLGDIPPTAYAELASRFGPCNAGASQRPRWLCYPSTTVLYLAMNHDRPLFGDDPGNGPGLDPRGNVALKQAVNYAIDRTAMLEQRGESAGVVTDQHLPLLIPGFQDADIYPSRPDLTKARQLAGCVPDCPPRQGVLYCSNRAPAPVICQIVQTNLRAIGLEMEIKLFPRAMQFELAGRRGEPFDMTLEGWHADYLDPWALFQTLDGTTLRPANNINFAYFNDPEYNARMAQIDALPSPARETAFGLLDAEIARNAAPWAAYAVPNDRYYFSDRVGCQRYSPAYTIDLAALCLRPAVSIADASVEEGNDGTRLATFTVSVAESAPADFPISVDYSTSDATADGSDYRSVSGTLTFANADAKTITVEVIGDTTDESDETFAVRLANATKGTIVRDTGIGTIRNDDAAPPPPPPPPDTQAPTDPSLRSTSHTLGVASTDRTVDVVFEGAADDRSGVDGFSFAWDRRPASVPDAVKDAEETAAGTTSPSLGNGRWWFHLRTRDNAGNWTSTRHLGPFVIVALPRCVVPELRGKTLERARMILSSRRCRLGRVTWRYAARVSAGRIVRQSHQPGTRLRRGAKVHLVVSKGARR
ncbi:MAG TPA: ABC transporter substrate-binding protein [Gaiellaceae bacterium]|nr:ABC transporter substrate-binding protein [Gaiellaceae bacterium]